MMCIIERMPRKSVFPHAGLSGETGSLMRAVRSNGRIPKTSERIAHALASCIVDQGFSEGALLPTEREMVATFRVGRTTLREALRLLETRGVLTIRPGPQGGPVVRRPKA